MLFSTNANNSATVVRLKWAGRAPPPPPLPPPPPPLLQAGDSSSRAKPVPCHREGGQGRRKRFRLNLMSLTASLGKSASWSEIIQRGDAHKSPRLWCLLRARLGLSRGAVTGSRLAARCIQDRMQQNTNRKLICQGRAKEKMPPHGAGRPVPF